MSAECFCGCGQKIGRFPLGARSINKRGQLVQERLAYTTSFLIELKDGHTKDWVLEGQRILNDIEVAQHFDSDPMTKDLGEFGIDSATARRSLDPSESESWLRRGAAYEALLIQTGRPALNTWLKETSRAEVIRLADSAGSPGGL